MVEIRKNVLTNTKRRSMPVKINWSTCMKFWGNKYTRTTDELRTSSVLADVRKGGGSQFLCIFFVSYLRTFDLENGFRWLFYSQKAGASSLDPHRNMGPNLGFRCWNLSSGVARLQTALGRTKIWGPSTIWSGEVSYRYFKNGELLKRKTQLEFTIYHSLLNKE